MLFRSTFADGEFRNNNTTRAATWNPDGKLNGARYITLAGETAYVTTPKALFIIDLGDPLKPRILSEVAYDDPRSIFVQFRYAFVTTRQGLEVLDVTRHDRARRVPGAVVPLADAHGLTVARTYAYVANGAEGMAIVDLERPERPLLFKKWNADGALIDTRDVMIASTNASLFAYVADGRAGLKVVQLTSPSSQPNFYGFSPEPRPELIARYQTRAAALSLSRPLERDRAVDESGGQVAVFGRRGARPFNLREMQGMYLDERGEPWFVEDQEVR